VALKDEWSKKKYWGGYTILRAAGKLISILIVIILFIYAAFSYHYISPKPVRATLDGIKFRIASKEDVESVLIPINGTYKPSKNGELKE